MARPSLNDRIRAYCEAHGLTFKPWEIHPAQADGACPWPPGTAGAASWPKAMAMRKEIIKRLKDAGA